MFPLYQGGLSYLNLSVDLFRSPYQLYRVMSSLQMYEDCMNRRFIQTEPVLESVLKSNLPAVFGVGRQPNEAA